MKNSVEVDDDDDVAAFWGNERDPSTQRQNIWIV